MADAGTHAGRAPGIKGAKVKVLLTLEHLMKLPEVGL